MLFMQEIIRDFGKGRRDGFEDFREKVLVGSSIPANFYIAAENVLNNIVKCTSAREKGQVGFEDAIVLAAANKLFDYKFDNYHEASCLLYYAKTISLIKTLKLDNSPDLLEKTYEEFGKFRFCLVLGKEFESPQLIKAPFASLILQTLPIFGKGTKLTKLRQLMNSAEAYFKDPQARARITLFTK